MIISLIAAVAKNRVIGNRGQITWRLPADLKHFKMVTLGHPIIMGRRTYESIGRPLPERTNIVVTRDPKYRASGCVVVASLEDAFRAAGDAEEVFIIGGGEIYRQALPLAEKLYITSVEAEPEGDVFFPEINPDEWRIVSREDHLKDERNQYDYSFLVYEKSPEKSG